MTAKWKLQAQQTMIIGAEPDLRHEHSHNCVCITSLFTLQQWSILYKNWVWVQSQNWKKLFSSLLSNKNSKQLPFSLTVQRILDSSKT